VLAATYARLGFRAVAGPFEERQDRLPGLQRNLFAELDRLGQNDLFFGTQQGDAADLAQVHPDRVVDLDHVDRKGLELLGGRLLERDGIQPGRAHEDGERFGVGGVLFECE
jgi:hypothetical protein